MDEDRQMPSESGPIVDLLQAAIVSPDFEALGRAVLPILADDAGTSGAFLAAASVDVDGSGVVCYGAAAEAEDSLRAASQAWLSRAEGEQSPGLLDTGEGTAFAMQRLDVDGDAVGCVGLLIDPATDPPRAVRDSLLVSLAASVARTVARSALERKLLHLNTYLTVSTMLSKSVDLEELLEIALFCSMDAVAAEAASILLLDEAKENFRFFHVEGAAKEVLGGTCFPAGEGVAGRVLQSQQAEIVDNAKTDEQFYAGIDQETGFRTRNMIAVPLVAGEERIGVLEVLNKAGDGRFTPDERLILESVADEIAFAIRNATLFDYIVNTYCKRRQGQNSCKGCERPLGSWTPCMRYREFLP